MAARDSIFFADFCVDTANECVRRRAEVVALTPKAFAVLRYLVDHRGRRPPQCSGWIPSSRWRCTGRDLRLKIRRSWSATLPPCAGRDWS